MATTKGIMGLLQFSSMSQAVRITSMGLKATQEISAMDTIDGTYDYTAYRLGPVRVEGDVVLPIPAANNMINTLLNLAIARDPSTGLLLNSSSIQAKYDSTVGYTYGECRANTASFSISAEEAAELTINFIGTNRSISATPSLYQTSPQRVLTWNEINVATSAGTSVLTGSRSNYGAESSTNIRNFSFEVNNNITVFFALNNQIFAQPENIVPGKREVTGSMEISWHDSNLRDYAYDRNAANGPANCTSGDAIVMTVSPECSGATTSTVTFNGIMYNMEEISMNNDFFVGTQTWKAYGKNSPFQDAIVIS